MIVGGSLVIVSYLVVFLDVLGFSSFVGLPGFLGLSLGFLPIF